MKKASWILRFAGVICIPVYIIFTFFSHLYNLNISPVTNWLSEYGNPVENPGGALLYNIGCTIVAALLIVFYIGISQWYKNRKVLKKYVICYICAQITGIIGCIFLILTAVYPLGVNDSLHGTFSLLNMIGMDCFLSFIAIAFLMNPNIKKWIGIFMYLSAIFNIITTNGFSSLYIAEWIFFLLFMINMVIITLNYDKTTIQVTGKGSRY